MVLKRPKRFAQAENWMSIRYTTHGLSTKTLARKRLAFPHHVKTLEFVLENTVVVEATPEQGMAEVRDYAPETTD